VAKRRTEGRRSCRLADSDESNEQGGAGVRRRVGEDDAADAGFGGEERAQRRPEQHAQVVVEGIERVCGNDLILTDQPGQERALGRAKEEPDRSLRGRDGVDRPQIGGSEEQREQGDRPRQIGRHHGPLPVPTIDEDPRHRASDDARERAGGERASGGQGRAGQAVDVQRQRHDQRKIAGDGDEPGQPEDREIAMTQCVEHNASSTGSDGPAPRQSVAH
jgi:hypothetical protein